MTTDSDLWTCEDCGWQWPLKDVPYQDAECDACGGEMHPVSHERLRELTETGSSVRYTGRPIMAAIAEALGPVCPRCNRDHNEPHCADGREWGPFGTDD